jgi:TonB family protein
MQRDSGSAIVSGLTLRSAGNERIIPVVIGSILFHIVVVLVLPLTTRLFWRPKKFERPKTFRLVTAPTASQPAPPRPAPAPRTAPAVKKPETPRPASKPSRRQKAPASRAAQPRQTAPDEDLSELAELLGGLPTPMTELSMAGDIQDYYKLAMQNKIEQHWKPAVQNPDIAVMVGFTVHYNGSISGLEVVTGSGNASLDKTALRAVRLASPFGKLPPGFTQKKLEVRCTLRPTRRQL